MKYILFLCLFSDANIPDLENNFTVEVREYKEPIWYTKYKSFLREWLK